MILSHQKLATNARLESSVIGLIHFHSARFEGFALPTSSKATVIAGCHGRGIPCCFSSMVVLLGGLLSGVVAVVSVLVVGRRHGTGTAETRPRIISVEEVEC